MGMVVPTRTGAKQDNLCGTVAGAELCDLLLQSRGKVHEIISFDRFRGVILFFCVLVFDTQFFCEVIIAHAVQIGDPFADQTVGQ